MKSLKRVSGDAAWVWAAVLFLGVCGVGGVGCEAPGGAVSGGRGEEMRGGWPFAPATVRLTPLTHLGSDGAGGTGGGGGGGVGVVCHVEVADRYGDSVKSPGVFVVTLYGPAEGRGAAEVQLTRWEIDAMDPAQNSRLYDPSTRTYRLRLGGVPEWIKVDQKGKRLVLRIEFRTVRFDGTEGVLEDDYVLAE